ncbi:MAG: hypothetical protein H0W89_03155 [Candidatus Levybacteria bacterium]|nr:hypothetical protein [Candidatus Levybacteria bacterium]
MDKSRMASGNWQTFLTLKGEKLLLVVREHLFTITMPVVILILVTIMLLIGGYVIFQQFFSSWPLFIITGLLLISTTISIITKLIIDWYFHIYILTNRKILEFRYTPLTSYIVNDIMLDRVYCTEVDVQTNGLLHDLIDMGDIMITFDRPTHQEEFVLRDIHACSEIGVFLTQQLMDGTQNPQIHPIWFRGHSYGSR